MKTKINVGIVVLLTSLFFCGVGLAAEKKYHSIFYSDEAEKYLERWESDKQWSDAIVNADALYKQKKFSEAAAEYEKAIEQGYQQPQGIFNLAHCQDQLGQNDNAFQNYLQAAKALETRGMKNSMLFEAYYRIGVLLGEKKNYAEASVYLEKARQIQSNNTDLLFSLGVVNHNQGRLDEAEKFYQAALGLDPNFEDAKRNLDKLQEKRNLPADWTEALKRNHLPGKIPLEIVQLDSLDSKTINEKIGQLEARLLVEKGNPAGQLHYELGLYYATAKEYSKALEHMEIARHQKYRGASSFLVGYIYYKMGETEKALAEYSRFVRKDPKDPVAHYNLAVLYDNQTDKHERAIHYYRRYLQLAKENARDADEVGRRIWLLSNVRNP